MAIYSLASAFGQPQEEQTATPRTPFADAVPQTRDDVSNLQQDRPQLEAGLRELRQSQEASLVEHQNFAETRRAQQAQLEERSADLDSIQRFLQLSDPTVPKPARAYMWKQFARSMGVDPKSQSASEIGTLLTQLDPDTLGALRGSILEASATAPGGSMRSMFRAVARGELPADQLFTRVADFSQRQAGQVQTEVAQAFPPNAPPQMAGAPRPQNYQVSPSEQEIDPGWSQVIPELQPGTRYRRSDVQRDFQANIPTGEDERKALAEFRTRQADYLKLQGQINNLDDIVRGRPDSLGPSGTIAQWLDSVQSQIGNVDRAKLEKNLSAVANGIIKAENITDAQAAALVRSRFAELTFAYARVLNGPGVLSQADIEGAAQTIGNSWSAGQSALVLRDVATRSFGAYQEWSQRQVGKDVGIPVERLSNRQVQMLSTSEATPRALRDAAFLEYERRVTQLDPGRREEQFQRDSVTPREPQRRSDTRRSPTPEAEEEGFRRQADTERRQGQEDRSRRIKREDAADLRSEAGEVRQNTQLELAIAQFRRAADWRNEDKAERRQEKIQAAIQQLAKALGSGPNMSVGRSGGGGSDQNPSAFVLPARPRRTPPAIPNVRRRGSE